jgi:hypothetical protein
VFWTRSGRDVRRQRVLDELLDLDPADRQGRLDIAIAAGDIRPNEVEYALRMVHRLEALRVMTIPSSAYLPGGIVSVIERQTAVETEAEPLAGDLLLESAEADLAETPHSEATTISIFVEPEPASSWLPSAPLPIDAVEAASRLIARDLAARRALPRKTPPGVRSSRRRRMHMTASTGSRPLRMSESIEEPEIADRVAVAQAEENWPSIGWLRP